MIVYAHCIALKHTYNTCTHAHTHSQAHTHSLSLSLSLRHSLLVLCRTMLVSTPFLLTSWPLSLRSSQSTIVTLCLKTGSTLKVCSWMEHDGIDKGEASVIHTFILLVRNICDSHRYIIPFLISLIQLALLVLCFEHTAQELVYLQHI